MWMGFKSFYFDGAGRATGAMGSKLYFQTIIHTAIYHFYQYTSGLADAQKSRPDYNHRGRSIDYFCHITNVILFISRRIKKLRWLLCLRRVQLTHVKPGVIRCRFAKTLRHQVGRQILPDIGKR